jgi:hypothetical protein
MLHSFSYKEFKGKAWDWVYKNYNIYPTKEASIIQVWEIKVLVMRKYDA